MEDYELQIPSVHLDDQEKLVKIPCDVLKSDAYVRLSHSARSLLIEFFFQYDGDNNGSLICKTRMLSKRGWKSNKTIQKACDQLIEQGFSVKTQQGVFGKPQQSRQANHYALTCYSIN